MDSELYRPFEVCFKIFKVCGMWQDGNQSWAYFFLGYSAHIFFLDIYLISIFIYAFQTDNLIDFTEAFGLGVINLAMFFKCVNFFIRIKSVMKSLESLKSLLELSAPRNFNSSRSLLKTQVNFGYKVFKIFYAVIVVTCVSGIFPPFLEHKLPHQIWFPFDRSKSEIAFWTSSILTISISPYIGSLDMAIDMLPVIFMTFAIGLIDELSERLGNLEQKTEMISEDKELIKCIQIHQGIIDYVKGIQNNFSSVILIQGVLGSIMLCLCSFTVSTVSSI